MPEVTDTTKRIAEAITNLLNTRTADRYKTGAITTGQVLEESKSRNGDRIFFDMAATQDLGIFATIIASARISAYYEKTDNGYWIIVNLSYTHPGGGSNGSNIARVWLDDTFELSAIRWPDGELYPERDAAA
jgi:hypothetical protein